MPKLVTTLPTVSFEKSTAQAQGNRDIWLDALRGLLLIDMTIEHLPSALRDWVSEGLGYVTAAEGFVFLSGFVAGLTYTRTSCTKGDSMMWSRARRRAGLIYAYHVITFLLLLLAFRMLGGSEAYRWAWKPLLDEGLPMSIFRGCSLLYQPRFLDILPMFCLYILITPWMIQQLNRGRGIYMVACSCLVWGLTQAGIFRPLTTWKCFGLPINPGDFNVFAWQFLFVLGLYAGSLRSARNDQPSSSWRPVLPFAVALSVLLFCCRHDFLVSTPITRQLDLLANKPLLGPVRVLNALALSLVLGWALRLLKPGFCIHSLAYLGRYSLQVFSYQVLLVYAVNLLLRRDVGTGDPNEVLIVIACVLSLYLPVLLLECRRQPGCVG